ncbi:MAG: archaellum component FlaC [Candidatus Paceibacteria bacterium]|jgi:archaellum component FlaC
MLKSTSCPYDMMWVMKNDYVTKEYLKRYMGGKFLRVDKKFDDIDLCFSDIDLRFSDVDKRFDDVDKRFSDVDKRFDYVDKKFDDIDLCFSDVDKRFDEVIEMFHRHTGALIEEFRDNTKGISELVAHHHEKIAEHDGKFEKLGV